MDTATAQRQMVEQQIRTWEVLDERVLEAISAVPRAAFVPASHREVAFADAPIPLACGQTMLPPNLHGRILQSLDIGPRDSVLEIGTGSGFLTACLARLGAGIRSIEIHPELLEFARANLGRLSGPRIELEARDAFAAEPLGEYDAIALTGSMPVYDARFERALKVGGRLFAVVGVAPAMEAMLIRRTSSSEWVRESLFETVIDPLIGAPAPAGFVF